MFNLKSDILFLSQKNISNVEFIHFFLLLTGTLKKKENKKTVENEEQRKKNCSDKASKVNHTTSIEMKEKRKEKEKVSLLNVARMRRLS